MGRALLTRLRLFRRGWRRTLFILFSSVLALVVLGAIGNWRTVSFQSGLVAKMSKQYPYSMPTYGVTLFQDEKNTRMHFIDKILTRASSITGREYCYELDCYYVAGDDVGDSVVEMLLKFPNLKHVNLSSSQITDAGFMKLTGLVKLREIQIYDTNVSDNAIRAFRKKSPGVLVFKVGWDEF